AAPAGRLPRRQLPRLAVPRRPQPGDRPGPQEGPGAARGGGAGRPGAGRGRPGRGGAVRGPARLPGPAPRRAGGAGPRPAGRRQLRGDLPAPGAEAGTGPQALSPGEGTTSGVRPTSPRMRLHAVNIPDDPAQLPAWLEQQLVGESLGELVAELAVVHAAPAAGATSLDEVLGNRQRALLASGLAVLPAAALKRLLQRPR